MSKFTVSYCILSGDDSEEWGEPVEDGLIDSGLSLRDAIKELYKTRTNEVDGYTVQANCYPLPASGWLEFRPGITVYNGMEFRTGEQENRSLAPEGMITAASWGRICKLAGVTA